MIAFCFMSGQIGFMSGNKPMPQESGGIEVARGPQDKLIEFVTSVARHGKDDDTLFVPGLVEAFKEHGGGDACVDALMEFQDKIRVAAKRVGIEVP